MLWLVEEQVSITKVIGCIVFVGILLILLRLLASETELLLKNQCLKFRHVLEEKILRKICHTSYSNLEDPEYRKMVDHAKELYKRWDRDVCCCLYISSDAITQFVSGISSIVIYCMTVIAVLMGRITLGSMIKYIQCIDGFITSSKSIWSICIGLWYNAEYLERFFAFLDIPQEMKKGCIPVEKRMDKEYKIVFDHVSFRYPNSETYALKDLNLEFKIGEKLAVVGMNGSGKTTFIKLLCRLYDPTEGAIYMNGIDIQRYQYEEYLSLFSVVFQDFKLFSFSIGENVAVEENYEESIVKTALEKAGLSEFLKEQKQGVKTVLYRDFDKEGIEISGGEAQKIALARAIYKGAAFVLLDEPTAALDPLAEYEIYKRFNEMVADRTTIYISHRMSSCRFCGDIAVFHEGSLVQRDSHEELIRQTEGMYYQLWSSQAQYYQIG